MVFSSNITKGERVGGESYGTQDGALRDTVGKGDFSGFGAEDGHALRMVSQVGLEP